MSLPPTSPRDARAAWRTLHDAEPPAWVLGHCRCVACLAVAMGQAAEAAGHRIDFRVLAAGALLHDIGRAVTQDVRHAGVGADLVRKAGWDEPVARVVERHTGAGIPADEAAALGLPARSYLPATIEEKIVAHADNLHAGETRTSLRVVVAKYEAQGIAPAARRLEALHAELEALLQVNLESLPLAQLDL